MRQALLLAAAVVALALPAAASAYYLPAARVNVRVAPTGALLDRREHHHRRRVSRRLPRYPAAQGRVDRPDPVSEQGEQYTRGGSTSSGRIDTAAHVQLRAAQRQGCGSSGTSTPAASRTRTRSRTVPRARRRLRRRRRRQPEGLGPELGRAARSTRRDADVPAADGARPAYRVCGPPGLGEGHVDADADGREAAGRQRPLAPVRRAARDVPALGAEVDRRREGRVRARARNVAAGSGRGRRVPARPAASSTTRSTTSAARGPHPPRDRRSGLALGLLLLRGCCRPRARDRLRPRVRAGAADRHRAGARPAARCARRPTPARRSSRRRSST